MLGTFDLTNYFYFRHSDLIIQHLALFCDKFISSSTVVLEKILIILIP